MVGFVVTFSVLAGGSLLGMLPFAAFLSSATFAVFYGCASLTAGVGWAIWRRFAESASPNIAGYAFLSSAAQSALAGWTGFALYGIAYAFVYIAGLLGIWTKLGWHANPGSVAFWVSGAYALLFGLINLVTNPTERIFEFGTTGRTPDYDSPTRSNVLRWSIPITLAAVALSITTYFLWPGSWWWHVVAVLSIVGAGAIPMSMGLRLKTGGVVSERATEALLKLYAAVGYQVIVSPRTKDANADLDSLLKWLDMLAYREQGALAIEVKTQSGAKRTVSAADASILPIAARAASRFLREGDRTHVRVEPVLVLVDQQPTVDLNRLAEDEGITVVSLPSFAVREALRTDDEAALRQLAHKYLHSDLAAASLDWGAPSAAGMEA